MCHHCVCATKRLMASITVIKLSEDEVPETKFKGKDVEEHTNIQLKRWLECRGLKKRGKKADLLNRYVHSQLLYNLRLRVQASLGNIDGSQCKFT